MQEHPTRSSTNLSIILQNQQFLRYVIIKHMLETKRRRRILDLAKMMHVFIDGEASRE